jgi:hypothetical protein
MRRILLLMAIATMLLSLMAGPALAQREKTGDLPPFKEETPGNPQSPDVSPATPTEQRGENCYGESASNFLKGPGGNPGSAAEPTPQFDSFNGPFISDVLREAREQDAESNPLADFQRQTAEENASCGDTGKPK